jgi:hypothetical protein
MITIKTSAFDSTKKHSRIVQYETESSPLDKAEWEYVDEYYLESSDIPLEIKNILGKLSEGHEIKKVTDKLYYAKDSNEKYHIFEVIL